MPGELNSLDDGPLIPDTVGYSRLLQLEVAGCVVKTANNWLENRRAGA